jgi:outer membrane lipoprotein-sorting protein
MSFALLSAISLMCVDGASAARPLMSPPAMTVAAVVQESGACAIKVEEIAPQPAMPAAIENEAQNDDAFDGPLAMENESGEAIADKLIAWLEGVDTLKGDFTQIAPSGAISGGKFYLRRPGFLRFEYAPPTPLLIVANGGMVYVRDEDLETTDSYPAGKTPLKFLLAKKIDRDDTKVVRVDRGIDTVAVTFASTNEETEGELTIIVNAPDFALRRWIVHDLQGGTTVVTLNDVVSGERLANNLFAAPDAGGRFLDR